MPDIYTANEVLNSIAAASKVLSERKDEINRLNVFPVPDGDTGTNMSLTLESVVANLSKLPIGASNAEVRRAITTGALMGARGNSGVITSQILRGLCEGAANATELSTETVDEAFSQAVEVAFQAVRKPVEGTILTVLRDAAAAAKRARKKKMSTPEALDYLVAEAYASVQRTPDLLPVLKENGVVDAGGFGLAILIDGFVAAITGKEGPLSDELALARAGVAPKVEIEQINDWEGSAYRYCNEFLVDSDTLDKDEALEFLATMGDCELCVGDNPKFKVHVHSNTPDKVLAYFLERGQISEVFIHNMQLQSAERADKLAAEQADEPSKPFGFVAVAAGEGNARILKSLGVDVVVSGGQTMNPSTKDLLDAVSKVNADAVIIMPNNSNIVMAAQSACGLSEVPCAVVPTKSVPQSFAALFGFDETATLEENVAAMTQSYAEVRTGEVTTAIKDSKDAHDNPIKNGDVIGIADGSIEAVGASIEDVVMDLLSSMEADDADTLTLLAGADYSDDALDALIERIEGVYDDIEIDSHRGEQPLYPIIFSVE
ncbi:DAK2 domain-containing protein [Adlercreutzia sp. ZJ141]|uniref:DAK2 domain-containing protein n=1 Tax=Adlercreutzia sp. ZJ141 TaxID=2709406 RepID=UPI0013EBDA87|nr:DAK2 domain-containing protein [Adlercreutzia sp. ZJ141]